MALSSRGLQACLAICASIKTVTSLEVCPGEGARYEDFKCNHDETHRVCAKLLDSSGRPQTWGSGNFWQITGQQSFQWDQEIRDNHGDSWCICMWATATLIRKAGCENVHLRCEATDIKYVLGQYNDGGVDLKPAHDCLVKKCGATAVQKAFDATVPQSVLPSKRASVLADSSILSLLAVVLGLTGAGVLAARHRCSQTHDQFKRSMEDVESDNDKATE